MMKVLLDFVWFLTQFILNGSEGSHISLRDCLTANLVSSSNAFMKLKFQSAQATLLLRVAVRMNNSRNYFWVTLF